MEENAGYIIRQSVLFDNGRGFALGESQTDPAPFVTWQFTQEDGKRDYYWGHYHEMFETAHSDYCQRISEYGRQTGENWITTQHMEYFGYYLSRKDGQVPIPATKDNFIISSIRYGYRRRIEGEPSRAWGFVQYFRPLTKDQIIDYGLRPSQYNPDYGRQADREQAHKKEHKGREER